MQKLSIAKMEGEDGMWTWIFYFNGVMPIYQEYSALEKIVIFLKKIFKK